MAAFRPDLLIDWAARVLQTAAVPAEDAALTARLLVRSDLRGYDAHGLARLASYVERLGQGDFNPRPEILFRRNGAAWTVEAGGALGQVAGQRILDAALVYLVDQPMLWVSLRKTGHLGALGVFALQVAEAGFVCLMGQRTPPLLGLPGFSRAAIGHNPFAFACPAGQQPPLVVDMACSVAARGHILLAAREGNPIPPGWALDASGEPTTHAKAALQGSLQPAGGYKGMGLAMMIECMAAGLAADAGSATEAVMKMPASGAVPCESAFFLFLNPAVLGNAAAFAAYAEHWIGYYLQSGADQARIPGDRGHESERERLANGIAYSASVEAELRHLGKSLGIAMPPPDAGHRH